MGNFEDYVAHLIERHKNGEITRDDLAWRAFAAGSAAEQRAQALKRRERVNV